MTFDIFFVVFTLAPFAIFLVMFGRPRHRWWKDAAGISVFTLSAALALAVALPLLRLMFDITLPIWLRLAIYSLIGIAGWVQLAVYLYTRRGVRRDARRTAARSEP